MGNGFRVGRGACSMGITQAHSTNITSEGWSDITEFELPCPSGRHALCLA